MTIKRATESFTYWDKQGVPHDYQAGMLVEFDNASDDLRKREHLFTDVSAYVENRESDSKARNAPRVETATAEPGERRNVTPAPARQFRAPGKKEE